MTVYKSWRPVATGWQYTVYVGCDTDGNGAPIEATADRMIGGWALTRDRAAEKAGQVARRESA